MFNEKKSENFKKKNRKGRRLRRQTSTYRSENNLSLNLKALQEYMIIKQIHKTDP